jgi:thymidylate synthase (FAD)
MKVELLDITENALEKIGRYAGICYNSSQERNACIKRAVACKDKGHLATLRFASATFLVKGISRICSHQMVRSAHLDFLQKSQRYCEEDVPRFVYPGTTSDTQISGLYQTAYRVYEDLIKAGVKKEDARFVLPEGTQTELVVTGNFQAWLDFIKLRADIHAQWEIRAVAKEINNLLAKELDNKLFSWMP